LKLRTILALAYSVLWLGFLLLLAVSWPAKAQAGYCAKWSHGIRCSSNYTLDFGPSCRRVRRCLHWVHSDPYRARDPHWTDVERRHRHYRPGRDIEISNKRGIQSCKDFVVRVTGDDRLSHERARTSAQDRWAVTVGTRYGTLWADIDNAEDQDMSCVKQAPSSTTEKTQADLLGIRHNICELVARPCQPVPKEQDSETRAKRRFER
jgi:hypothetical protein